VQVLRHRAEDLLPADVLASIAAYYRRVTTTARPLGHLVALAMFVTSGAALVAALRAFRDGAPVEMHVAAFALAAAPAALALVRVVPNAVRLGARGDGPEIESALARAICRDPLLCLASIAAFVALQIALATR
jgi:hypothetical protein